MSAVGHPWLPRTTCDRSCVSTESGGALRAAGRTLAAALLLPLLPVLAMPLPGRVHIQRGYCRLVLRCLGVRIRLSGAPIRNLGGVMVVSNHISWVDIFVIGAVMPGSFVARADLVDWPGVGAAARIMKVIPIDRTSLRGLPAVVETVTRRLGEGRTVVVFPEGTTYCGRSHGRFHPAMFQGAVTARRPVQPVHLAYRHTDGSRSTVPVFVGDDSLGASVTRIIRARRTLAHVDVGALQLPGASRHDLAARCEAVVRGGTGQAPTRDLEGCAAGRHPTTVRYSPSNASAA